MNHSPMGTCCRFLLIVVFVLPLVVFITHYTEQMGALTVTHTVSIQTEAELGECIKLNLCK